MQNVISPPPLTLQEIETRLYEIEEERNTTDHKIQEIQRMRVLICSFLSDNTPPSADSSESNNPLISKLHLAETLAKEVNLLKKEILDRLRVEEELLKCIKDDILLKASKQRLQKKKFSFKHFLATVCAVVIIAFLILGLLALSVPFIFLILPFLLARKWMISRMESKVSIDSSEEIPRQSVEEVSTEHRTASCQTV